MLEANQDKTSGLGIVRFDKPGRRITIECWPYLADPARGDKQFEGWPVQIEMLDNYGRAAKAHLPTLSVSGSKSPVIEVYDEQSGELLYALRAAGNKFRPHVFAEGKYKVRVSDPEAGKQAEQSGLEAKPDNDAVLEIKLS